MTSKEANAHQKHAKLNRPQIGEFGRNELAFLGTPCGKIKQWMWAVMEAAPQWRWGFVDADHKATDIEQEPALGHGAHVSYTDKINFGRFDGMERPNKFQVKSRFAACDAVLVNGNHFLGQRQVVIIDPKKPLDRKLDRITAPLLVIKTEEADDVPDYLAPLVSEVPQFNSSDVQQIVGYITNWVQQHTPSVKALILAGGKSTRMASDKGALNYHGASQRQFLYRQLTALGLDSYVSCRADQAAEIEDGLPQIHDKFIGLGPMGALLSAFQQDPDSAWLAVACDLPFLSDATLQFLLQNRNPSKIATAFNSPDNEFPEPLITIWEPKSYSYLFNFLTQGYSCPRKVLINSDVQLLDVPNPKDLSNVNHPHEYQKVLEELKG